MALSSLARLGSVVIVLLLSSVDGFSTTGGGGGGWRGPQSSSLSRSPKSTSTTTTTTALGYEPKWKKKETLANSNGGSASTPTDFKNVGLIGTVPVVFRQGNETKRTMAIPGQPLRDAATQAGQFIQFGCGKGECGTCEALVEGVWIRPCCSVVPAMAEGRDYVVTVKEVKAKAKSSGKFYSVRSFFMGFYNNAIGMIGFVKYRRNANRNWDERQEYEDLVRQKTLEKKRARDLELQSATAASNGKPQNKLTP